MVNTCTVLLTTLPLFHQQQVIILNFKVMQNSVKVRNTEKNRKQLETQGIYFQVSGNYLIVEIPAHTAAMIRSGQVSERSVKRNYLNL